LKAKVFRFFAAREAGDEVPEPLFDDTVEDRDCSPPGSAFVMNAALHHLSGHMSQLGPGCVRTRTVGAPIADAAMPEMI
jgi:hypothetical protein